MTDYHKYINALRKCAKEHENDRTFTGHIIVADLCRDTANLLEELEKESRTGHCENCDACIKNHCGDALCFGNNYCNWQPKQAEPSAEPQEVIYSDDGYIANCPNCNCVYEIDDLVWGCNFCPKCGQALRWEGEEENDIS